MEKHEILNIIHGAIIDVSPAAAELLIAKKGWKKDICFVDLGINSINYAEIAHIVMSKLKVSYPLNIFTCTNRINDFVDILSNLILTKTEVN